VTPVYSRAAARDNPYDSNSNLIKNIYFCLYCYFVAIAMVPKASSLWNLCLTTLIRFRPG
jgi:hypothetical protein